MIYFIYAPEVGRIKIGYSSNWQNRFLDFMVGCPTLLDVLAVTEGGRAEERALHRVFGRSRWRGEWFNETPELLDFCRRVKAGEPDAIAKAVTAHREANPVKKIKWDKAKETALLRACTAAFVKKYGQAATAVIAGTGLQITKLWEREKVTIGPPRLARLMAHDGTVFEPFWGFQIIPDFPDLRALRKELDVLICQIEGELAA